jgi:hypothetical protein
MPVRRVLMFVAGAAIGYCLVSYYGNLLWARDSAATLLVTFVIAPAGAAIFGVLGALFVRNLAIFAAATVIGYLVLTLGWVAYADIFNIADREGGKGMAMIFLFAPAGGAMIGLLATALLMRPADKASSAPP